MTRSDSTRGGEARARREIAAGRIDDEGQLKINVVVRPIVSKGKITPGLRLTATAIKMQAIDAHNQQHARMQ